MAKNIDPELRKIGTFLELEDDAVFTIPEYQRAYSWGIEQCDKLWNDIVDFADIADNPDNERYFFGTIIINCEDGDDKLELIDGQQRTTTFLLLLKAILMCLNTTIKNASNDEEAIKLYRALQDHRRTLMKLLYKAKVENIPDEPDSDADKVIYQNTNILINNSINEQYKEELTAILKSTDFTDAENKVYKYPRKQKDNKYTNYFRNFKYLYNKVSTESESRLNIIIQTLLRRCEVIEIKSWKVEQAVEMFNSLNSDGLPLNDADIISAHLFKIAKSNNELEQYIAKWEELAIQIEKLDKLKISSIDSILMQQMYFERAVDKLTLSNSDSVNVTTPGVRRYFKVLNKKSTKEPVKLCDDMLNLAKIWEIIYDYPVTQVIFKFNENFKLFLASYLHRFKSDDVLEDQIVPVIKALLKLFVILEVVDTGYSSSKFKSFLFS